MNSKTASGSKSDEWWMSIKTGRGSWTTFFEDGTADAMLDVKAVSMSGGYYLILVQHKQRMALLRSVKQGKEGGVF